MEVVQNSATNINDEWTLDIDVSIPTVFVNYFTVQFSASVAGKSKYL